ncbi:inverse autotransporter beta domain-containing protein, partial [Vibrio mediterranei]
MSDRTNTPLQSLLKTNKATLKTPLPKGNIWVHAPLYTPHSSFKPSHVGGLPSLGSDRAIGNDSSLEDKIASELSQAGRAIDEGGVRAYSDALEMRAENYGDAQISDAISGWLASYGTVEVSTDVLTNMDDPSASFNMLHPLYDDELHLFFVQLGYQLNNESSFSGRDFLNVGLGYRIRNENSVFGLNAFYDADLDRGHRRGSVGIEYFEDYMKVSGNYYFPLSDWKESSDLDYYLERPAQGVDEKITGYLPSYPQLGASLEYEQYFGDEVDILGSQHREKDPYAVTVEGEYTPIPAVTLHAGIQKAKGETTSLESELDFTYRFGVPWRKQISPDYVAESRQLSWQWRDLVDRNNNIVLEYKKKEVFTAAVSNYAVQALNAGDNFNSLKLSLNVNGQPPSLKGYDIQWYLPAQFLVAASSLPQPIPAQDSRAKRSLAQGSVSVIVPPFGGTYQYKVIVTHIDSGQSKTVTGTVNVDSSLLNGLSRTPKASVDLSKDTAQFELQFASAKQDLEQAWEKYVQSVVADKRFESRVETTQALPHLATPYVDMMGGKVELHTDDKRMLSSSISNKGSFQEVYSFGGKTLTFPIALSQVTGNALQSGADKTVFLGSGVFTQSAQDGNGGKITYSSSNKGVAIVDASSGEVRPISVGIATITATEQASGLFSQQQDSYTLNVKPRLTLNVQNGIVPENQGFRQQTKLTGSQNQIVYSITGEDAGEVNINASGIVSMRAHDYEQPTDKDKDNVYRFNVVATDAGGNAVSQVMTITVTNVKERANLSLVVINGTVAENVAFTSATPQLTGSPVGAVRYSVTGVDAGMVTVNANTGVVSMGPKDFEAPDDANGDHVYNLTLVATDADGNSASQAMTITVTNVTEQVTLSLAVTNGTVAENVAFTSATPQLTGSPVGA